MNNVTLIGNLVRDMELKYTGGGTAIGKMSIAVNERRKQGEEWVDQAHFFDMVLWGKRAEALAQYLLKGKKVGIQGRLQQQRWETDGQTRSKVEIVVEDIELLGGNPQRNTAADKTDQVVEDDIPF